VSLPVCEIGGMKSTHIKLLSVLLSFSDRNGKCWPSLRTIAERAKETLSWVQRNLHEMESLGYFTRARRLQSYVYHLAARFLWRPKSDTYPRRSQGYEQAEPKASLRRRALLVYQKGQGRCWYCGDRIGPHNFQIDHVQPRSDHVSDKL